MVGKRSQGALNLKHARGKKRDRKTEKRGSWLQCTLRLQGDKFNFHNYNYNLRKPYSQYFFLCCLQKLFSSKKDMCPPLIKFKPTVQWLVRPIQKEMVSAYREEGMKHQQQSVKIRDSKCLYRAVLLSLRTYVT